MLGRTTLWSALTILSAAYVFAAQQAPLPAGPGKQILDKACSSCHEADVITKYHFTKKEDYADIVSSMIGAGAVMTKQEETALVDYLFDSLGQKTPAAAPAGAATASDEAGKAILEQACTSCHGLDGMKNHVYTNKDDYKSLVQSMIGNGATVSNDQLPVLVDYLFKIYGKK